MAKKGPNREDPKKGAPRINPSELRIQTLRVADIQNAVDDARDFLASIVAILEQCREKKVESCVVDGATKLERANRLLEDFSGHLYKGATKAITEARRSRGSQDQPSDS